MAIALIPARGGSKGIKNKNLVKIGGKSLIQLSIECAVESGAVRKVFLDSDSDEIIEEGKKYGAVTPFKRPARLAKDDSNVIESLKLFLNKLEKLGMETNEPIILLQPTSPLRTPKQIIEGLDLWTSKMPYVSVASISEPIQSPKDLIFYSGKGWKTVTESSLQITNRQSLDGYKFLTGSIYIFTLEFLRKHNSIVTEGDTLFFETSQESAIDIDTVFDLKIARLLSQDISHG
jgi:CMP-N-acetylneuraminic acid synthetase